MKLFFIFIWLFLFLFWGVFADESACIKSYQTEIENLTKEYRTNLFSGFKGFNSQKEKAQVAVFNFRMYKCNLEYICKTVDKSIFKNDFTTVWLENVWCAENPYKIEDFPECWNDDAESLWKISGICFEKIAEIKDAEKVKMISEFKNYSEKSKSDAVSSKLFWLNERMRILVENMNNLKVYLHKIIDWISCMQK